jgi:hypothetical protein
MKQHYDPDEEDKEGNRDQAIQHRHIDEHHPHHPHHHSDHHVVPENRGIRKNSKKRGSPYVAADKMHPNDEGYELWGRHIAAAIIEHWNREDQSDFGDTSPRPPHFATD